MCFRRNLNVLICFSVIRYWLCLGQATSLPSLLGRTIFCLLVFAGGSFSVAQQFSDEEFGKLTRYHLDAARDGDAEAQYMAAHAYRW